MASKLPPRLPLAIQLCPLSDYLESELARRVNPIRYYAMDDGEQAAFLASNSADVRLVATGGHIGCPPDLLAALPALGLIAINGVGFDKVDLRLARQHGVAVSNTPDVLTDDVADLAVGLIIAQFRGIAAGDGFVRGGRWLTDEMPLGRKVSGSRFGVLGLGRIGGAIAARLSPFGPVGYYARAAKGDAYQHFATPADLARWADVLIVACAANADTAGLVDAAVLRELGPRGVLVNIARGSVVDERALVAALADGTIAGAGLDVFADEPRVPAGLIASPRTVLTPHVGSATAETRAAMADLVLANIDAFLAGQPLPTAVP